jgi:hypothetical protein
MRYLYRVGEDRPFAYAPTRRDFFLVSDDRLWAHESHAWLLSATSSAAFARRIGGIYYDTETGEPSYYEAAGPEPAGPAVKTSASVTEPRQQP